MGCHGLIISNIWQQRVLNAGISRLHRLLVIDNIDGGECDLGAMPKRTSGSSLILGASFLKRLIVDCFHLKDSMESDVSAAQPDLKYLGLAQLLCIRVNNLDFLTESARHSAHHDFLSIVDTQIWEKLLRRCLRGEVVAPPKASASLRALGRQLLLILGAVEVLDSGWADNNAGTTSRPVPTPSCWVVKLDWASSYALFHSHELWFEALTVESPEDFSLLAAGCKVGLVSDRSSGTDKDRGLHWEITILDPLIDDIVQEMELRDGNSQSKLTIELSGALLERFATRTDLGLEPFEASERGVSGDRKSVV